MNRRTLLLGILFGLLVGVGLQEALFQTMRQPDSPAPCRLAHANFSYSQQGEDLIILDIFRHLRLKRPSYLDIGAWEPVKSNNTYLFYRLGSRGVLVEPNPVFA